MRYNATLLWLVRLSNILLWLLLEKSAAVNHIIFFSHLFVAEYSELCPNVSIPTPKPPGMPSPKYTWNDKICWNGIFFLLYIVTSSQILFIRSTESNVWSFVHAYCSIASVHTIRITVVLHNLYSCSHMSFCSVPVCHVWTSFANAIKKGLIILWCIFLWSWQTILVTNDFSVTPRWGS